MEKDGLPVVEVKQKRLEDFETAVYAADHEKATQELYHVLKALHSGVPFEGLSSFGVPEATRVASAIVALFSHPKFKLSQQGFNLLSCEYTMFDAVFKASGFGDATVAFRLITDASEGLNKYLLLFALDSELEFDFEKPFRDHPQETAGLYFGMLGHWMVFSERAHQRRDKLIDLAPIFDDIDLDPALLNVLCQAYMHVSYADHPKKHEPKRLIHKLIAKIMREAEKPVAQIVRQEKPTIVMPLEWWSTHHVMYRDFGWAVRKLRERFRVVGMARKDNTNEEARAEFDDFIYIGDPVVLTECADAIRAHRPDIIFYPALGMSVWSAAMASMRLAPLQVMAYGHPATSNSPFMDYGIVFGDEGPQDLHSEKLIVLGANHRRRYLNLPPKVHQPTRGGPVKIAIPAMQAKITWPFIKCLQEVQQKADRQVECVFLPPVGGILLQQMARQLEKMLRHVIVCDRATNQQYLAWMAECDIATFSFPFGGSNSTLDAMLCGVPMVGMRGRELHEIMDTTLMSRAGLPDWLMAKNHDEYVGALLRLMDDDVRAGVAEKVRAIDMKSSFYDHSAEEPFLKAFVDMYERHAMKEAA